MSHYALLLLSCWSNLLEECSPEFFEVALYTTCHAVNYMNLVVTSLVIPTVLPVYESFLCGKLCISQYAQTTLCGHVLER